MLFHIIIIFKLIFPSYLAYFYNDILCNYCLRQGKYSPVEVVDHKEPHKGNEVLFWDQSNWQSLCKDCHDSLKQAKERSGLYPGCGSDGIPLDPDHPWNGGGAVKICKNNIECCMLYH